MVASNVSGKMQPLSLLNYHRPKIKLQDAPIPELSKDSKACLRRLVSYRRPNSEFSSLRFPRSRSAAVLVALFVGRMGDLYVLLSRRSSSLRTYAGDTALPGGKVDESDASLEDTARREAFEEIGLPKDRSKVPLLCVLEPFLATNGLIVTPIVVLILDNTLRPVLNAAEVATLFSHPLAAFLSSTPPFPAEPEYLHVAYHSYVDNPWPWTPNQTKLNGWQTDDFGDSYRPQKRPSNSKYDHPIATVGKTRAHRFLTGREAGGVKPVFGLTAGILIRTAIIGYARQPDFELHPPSLETPSELVPKYVFTPSLDQRIAYAICNSPTFGEAYETEGISVDWSLLERTARGKQNKRGRSRSSKL